MKLEVVVISVFGHLRQERLGAGRKGAAIMSGRPQPGLGAMRAASSKKASRFSHW
jgi:hypothetical protein